MTTFLFRRVWSVVLVCGTTVLAITAPLRVLAAQSMPSWMVFLDYAIIAVMAIDAVIRWRQAGAWRTSNPWLFAVDVLAIVPFGMLLQQSPLELLRLVKLTRVVQTMGIWWQRNPDKWNFLRLAYSGYWIALLVHTLSCGWFALRMLTPSASAQETSYLTALYWCVTTLTSVGYGDITPATSWEMVYAIGVMVVGVGIFGYVIGNIAHIIANLHPSRVRYVETMEGINAFLQYRGVPVPLQRRIREYYSYRWEKRLGFDEVAILDDLSPSLRADISLFLKRDVIAKVPFFQGAGEELVRAIALAMRPQVYMDGDMIVRAGELGSEMFFIGRGSVEILGKDGTTVQATLRDGEFFGELALVRGQPRNASVRAVGFCDLYALDKPTFDSIMAQHPGFAAHIDAMIRERFGSSP